MAENLYGCIYFPSDKTVSVVPKSRCILRGEFKELGEVEVKWRVQGKQQTYIGIILRACPKQEKHLLDRYSEGLHPFIKSSITAGRAFSAEDLIRQWKADPQPPADGNTESGPPRKKKRLESKTSTNDKPRKSNKDKAHQKKSIDSSSALAAQEIIALTQYNNVFPSASAPRQQQLHDLEQEDDLLAPHSQPNSLFQQTQQQRQEICSARFAEPTETQQQQQHQYQPLRPQPQQQKEQQKQKQEQKKQQQQQQRGQQQQEQEHQKAKRQQLNQKDMSRPQMPRQLPQLQEKNKYQEEQRRFNFPDQQQLLFDQQSTSQSQWQQRWNHSTQHSSMLQQSNSDYLNMLEDVVASSSKQGTTSSDDVSCLGTTRAAITSAMTTLSNYRDGFHDSSEDPDEAIQDYSLDDSGIFNSDSDNDDGNETNRTEHPCTNLKFLREKIARLEKENDQLKAKLGVYEITVPSPQVLDYLRRLVELFDGSDILLQESNSAHQREIQIPTSYKIKANFKPSEGEVRLLKGHEVFVPANKLRQLINESKVKGPIHLLQKLIPLVFTVEELANSCGQGISNNSKTQGTSELARKPLDQVKTKVLKDYLLSFCVTNGKDCPQPKQINEIFTQQVSYSRRKLHREKRRCTKFDQECM